MPSGSGYSTPLVTANGINDEKACLDGGWKCGICSAQKFRNRVDHCLRARRGGTRTGVLPDFFIGAHAAIARLTLLTRDAQRYRTYFPTIDVVAPPR